MDGSEWVGIGIAGLALVVSGVNAVLAWRWRWEDTRKASVEVFAESGKEVELLDVAADEFPLSLLGSGARYPIPWLLSDKKAQDERRFRCRIQWSDKAGKQSAEVPLRRGETSV